MKTAMFKSQLILAVAVSVSCLCRGEDIIDSTQKDVRSVNGKDIDLAPLHAWYLNPRGDRPLKHWKKLEITDVDGLVATWPRCVCTGESGVSVRILMTAIPERTKSVLDAMKANAETIARLSAEIEAEQAAWRRDNAVTLTGASGPAPHNSAVAASD
jgi:hypothetical protein